MNFECTFDIIVKSGGMAEWQTRMIQVHVGQPMQIQVLLSAQTVKIRTLYQSVKGSNFWIYLDYPNFNCKSKKK